MNALRTAPLGLEASSKCVHVGYKRSPQSLFGVFHNMEKVYDTPKPIKPLKLFEGLYMVSQDCTR